MTIEEARRQAFIHGFDAKKRAYCERACLCELLMPEWWQALGRALGWGIEHRGRIVLHKCSRRCLPKCLLQWHRFIDHLAAGKDPEEYFKDLLSPSKP